MGQYMVNQLGLCRFSQFTAMFTQWISLPKQLTELTPAIRFIERIGIITALVVVLVSALDPLSITLLG